MGINFISWLRGRSQNDTSTEVDLSTLIAEAEEISIYELSRNICINLIASAMGRCEFKVFSNGKEDKTSREYYLWNVEPNENQNSTAFVHKLIDTLYRKNELLIVEGKKLDNGIISLHAAEDWTYTAQAANAENKYTDIMVNDMVYRKSVAERNCIHVKLNNSSIKPWIDTVGGKVEKLANDAMSYLAWSQGQHWKVHINQIAQGAEDWEDKFRKILEMQIKPFLQGSGALLPEFDGYTYSDVRGDRNYQSANGETATAKNLVEEIFNLTCMAYNIPLVMLNGKVEATGDANRRFLTHVIDPICDQLGEEISRKRFGYEGYKKGNYVTVDSSLIMHFDLLDAAAGIEKLIGSGAFSVNDVRRAVGQSLIAENWADEYYLTKNIGRIGGRNGEE